MIMLLMDFGEIVENNLEFYFFIITSNTNYYSYVTNITSLFTPIYEKIKKCKK
jgi:hypothetical protein